MVFWMKKKQQKALEIASGTGAHLEVFAPAFKNVIWQPSEYVPELSTVDVGKIGNRGGKEELEVIDSVGCKFFPDNVLPAIALNAATPADQWPLEAASLDLVSLKRISHYRF